MNATSQKSGNFWKYLALLLVLALGAQGLMIYKIWSKNVDTPEQIILPEIKLKKTSPRIARPILPPAAHSQSAMPKSHQYGNSSNQLMSALGQQSNQRNRQINQSINNRLRPSQRSSRLGKGMASTNLNMGSMMNQVGNDPFDDIAQMRELMREMMSDFGGTPGMGSSQGSGIRSMGRTPHIKLDQNNNYVIKLNMPGLEKSEIKAQINGGVLTVAGVQKEEIKNQHGSMGISMGQSYRQFQNSFSLPGPVKEEKMKVDYNNDTLTIRIPKA